MSDASRPAPTTPAEADRPTLWWDLARVLLVGSFAALAAAAWLAFWPVENPGVQDCGSPAVAIVSGLVDAQVPAEGDELRRLLDQEPCSQRAEARSLQALLVLTAGVALGVIGGLFGLVDDRVRLHRAPRFETLLRDRPPDAPRPARRGRRHSDGVPTPSDRRSGGGEAGPSS